MLPTPEVVPFRLTRDLVHGLGPLGLQARFIPAAQAALEEFRQGADIILTLIQIYMGIAKIFQNVFNLSQCSCNISIVR
ncbi:unnamed protein product [Protopolystoma xenopodis]|uniref:PI3K/PI4K catalytic domain-containing protein n=1 Tax=Protopolystoma xenopodis TaxID=117903 RepID=A0A3S5CSD8_9PLAT|nr:unnamed protein product [Protopolystoma xenopodis]